MTARSLEDEVVDVITPYSPEHTSEELLERCKESVEKQGIETNHIIVENTVEPAYGRNKGLEEKTNRFVAFLDADDYWKEDKLNKQLQSLKNSDAGISVTDSKGTNGSTGLPTFAGSKIQSQENFLRQLILGGVTGVTSSILIDAEKLGEQRFDESLYRFEDHEYLLRCSNKAGIEILPEELTVVEKTNSGLSENTDSIQQTNCRIEMLREKQDSFSESYSGIFDQALAVQYRWLARQKLRRGDADELLDLYRESLSRKPLVKTVGAMALDLPRGVLQ